MPNVEVIDVPEDERFVARVDGDIAGFTVYHVRGGRYFFVHTEMDQAYAGQGIGPVLVRGALDAMREAGNKIIPICPFVWGFIQRNPDYDDLVDHEMFDRIADRLHDQ